MNNSKIGTIFLLKKINLCIIKSINKNHSFIYLRFIFCKWSYFITTSSFKHCFSCSKFMIFESVLWWIKNCYRIIKFNYYIWIIFLINEKFVPLNIKYSLAFLKMIVKIIHNIFIMPKSFITFRNSLF